MTQNGFEITYHIQICTLSVCNYAPGILLSLLMNFLWTWGGKIKRNMDKKSKEKEWIFFTWSFYTRVWTFVCNDLDPPVAFAMTTTKDEIEKLHENSEQLLGNEKLFFDIFIKEAEKQNKSSTYAYMTSVCRPICLIHLRKNAYDETALWAIETSKAFMNSCAMDVNPLLSINFHPNYMFCINYKHQFSRISKFYAVVSGHSVTIKDRNTLLYRLLSINTCHHKTAKNFFMYL